VLGGKVVLTMDRPLTVHVSPHQTVSQSEDGFEKIMQAVTVRVVHPHPSHGLGIILAVE